MVPIHELIDKDGDARKKIAVVGDAMIDSWCDGEPEGFSQEDCIVYRHVQAVGTPGGAANAARQLTHWRADVRLISPIAAPYLGHFADVNDELCFPCESMPEKWRYRSPGGKVMFRADHGDRFTHASDSPDWCKRMLTHVAKGNFDAVLLADYDKGFLDLITIQELIELCAWKNIPIVVDAKRPIDTYKGAIIKANMHYARGMGDGDLHVITRGPLSPLVGAGALYQLPDVPCRNHVGAGDCFAAHLTLGLAHGMDLGSAAFVAYSAGRVYVQHDLARPPWPHEIARDSGGSTGKLITPSPEGLEALRLSVGDKIVIFTNGVFRVPHAGHAWYLRWARSQGDLLVVGVNDDKSAKIAKGPENFVLPIEERVEWLTSLECVDWVIPFPWPDPIPLIKELKPDVLVKGAEYAGRRVPGDDMVRRVLFAPADAYPRHCTDLVGEFRK